MSQDFRTLFIALKNSNWAPYKQVKTVYVTFLFLQRYLIQKFKIWKSCPLRQQLCGHEILALGNPFFQTIAIIYVNTPKYLFHLIIPLKSVRGIQILPSAVCPRSHCPGRLVNNYADCVRLVNDLAEIASTQSISMLTLCPWSQRLCRHVSPLSTTTRTHVLRNRFCLFIWGL